MSGGCVGARRQLASMTPFPTPATQLRAPCRQFASLQFWTMMAFSRSYLPIKPGSLLRAFARWKSASRRLRQEPALRAELFSADQMELHGVRLAGQHRLVAGTGTGAGLDHLLPRLTNNEATLLSAYERLTKATLNSYRVTPAAEWLLDNYYLIAEQIRIARHHLPKGIAANYRVSPMVRPTSCRACMALRWRQSRTVTAASMSKA